MKIAHLILAHKNSRQLGRLLGALAHPDVTCYVHLDRKTDAAPFLWLANRSRVHFTRTRNAITWGGYSQTRNTVECLGEILTRDPACEFINVLSGQDYPLAPPDRALAFLAGRRGESFLATEPPGGPWWQANHGRLSRYHLTEYAFPGRYLVQQALNALLPARRLPLAGPLYGGPTCSWSTLARPAARYLVDFLADHADLRRFAHLTWGSDEFLLPTVLLNSPLAATVSNDSLRYIDWRAGGATPKLLTSDDLPELLGCGKLWARKFDIHHDATVLDSLDVLALGRPQEHSAGPPLFSS
ncbi:beta-1,6-N-acetylglucosaminyltransferase [Hymenobacter rigui]|uniref:Peptide O-xylosyltransferase n=1 Tax=Hymenobacter rigui TaxID=334424 RepID=A0A3R9MDC5_9BACT|nr:beta-1,6-N-acetylglucosaminyltransferase [Hymenobacter rigui]RSK43151.1 glycosyl transferase [Hymenobacter rigui]